MIAKMIAPSLKWKELYKNASAASGNRTGTGSKPRRNSKATRTQIAKNHAKQRLAIRIGRDSVKA